MKVRDNPNHKKLRISALILCMVRSTIFCLSLTHLSSAAVGAQSHELSRSGHGAAVEPRSSAASIESGGLAGVPAEAVGAASVGRSKIRAHLVLSKSRATVQHRMPAPFAGIRKSVSQTVHVKMRHVHFLGLAEIEPMRPLAWVSHFSTGRSPPTSAALWTWAPHHLPGGSSERRPMS